MRKGCRENKRRNLFVIGWLYLKHLFRGKRKHRIHSPFVYKLLDDCIYVKSSSFKFESIEKQRKKLKTDNRLIEVFDFGSYKSLGSNYSKRKLKVKTIARRSVKGQRQAALLHRLADYFECRSILELGTCFGITTAYLSLARPESKIYTIEGCPQVAEIAKSVFEDLSLENICMHVGDVDELLVPVLNDMGKPPDMAFMDANHTEKATINYFNTLLKYHNENTIVVIDDIHWSGGMENAWKEICSHPEVTVTIDLFYMGLVFFRKDLSKERFFIRF